MNRLIISLFAVLLVIGRLFAQSDSITYEVSTIGVISTGDKSPFWIQSNRFGEISPAPKSLVLELLMEKEFSKPDDFFDYSFLISGHIHEHERKINLELSQYYFGTRIWIFNVGLGSRHILHGNQDYGLSGGGLLFSSNSAPIPALHAGIDEFTPLFFKNGFLKVKGGIAHGKFTDNAYVTNLLYHHKFAQIQLGADKYPIHLQYGLDHAAQWGGIIPGYGQQPVDFTQFMNIFLARGGQSTITDEQINIVGNHIISQSARLNVDIKKFTLGLYWQNINEDKPILPIWNAVNIADGLWGISIRNADFPIVKGVVYEYLNTTDQNGPYHDLDGVVYGGGDSYFYNYLYRSGWTNFGRTIGTPFITSPVYNSDSDVAIQNNRVRVHHFGIEGDFKGYEFRIMNSFTTNYGTYSIPFPEAKKSVNFLIEVNKHYNILKGIDIGLSVGVDEGNMYGNNAGFMFKIAKSGTLFHLKPKK